MQDQLGRNIKVAVVVYATDPQGNRRILMRHNSSYDGKHPDEWTFVWGTVEENETFENCATREVLEELSISKFESVIKLEHSTEFVGTRGKNIAFFFAMEVNDINIPIKLNNESIGYDWMLLKNAKEIMIHENDKVVFDLVKEI